ncbi:uncharacterized protein LOC116302887 isoform X2 [Actinia tenebrosa]|uniref:Uncharacterized protein LOC116302887 isoform X2 n=1 Tax=Actinia tenebrosa TaxID=6105 RepID=A0A6P8IMS0_ACTTE|nr:uncharacterized protein LOC116302887 isoform X2 [Actinia tenebrosa]
MAGFIKFVVKCGIAGGIVYGVASQDLFSSQDRAISSFKQLKSTTQSNLPIDAPELPSKSDVRQKWNAGVQYVFSSLDKAPDTIKDLSSKGIKKTKDFVKEQMK